MKKETRSTYIVLTLLLLLAAVLRLIHPFQIPFTTDELGALNRTEFNSFSELISKGVIIDAHPAGVQVFLYYWTKFFGYSEIAVKLPFIICGILSVLYVFRLGQAWFNSTTGLVCAAFVATVQYTIMYSQIARPYSSGLFLSLVMVWYWNKVVFKPEDTYVKNLFLFILLSVLCAYNHHFNLLFAGIVGLTGLFFVRGKFLLKYLLAGLGIFILYIPHLHIFFYQLHIGGVGQWLGKPQNDFIIQYIGYILQFSILAYIAVGLLFLIGIINLFLKKNVLSPFYFISLAWFLLPFLIGFYYSRYVNPVLQYSVLIFSFPFLLFSFFGLMPDFKSKARNALVLIVCAVNVFVLISQRKYYDLFYQSHYERQVVTNDSLFKNVPGCSLTALAQSKPDSITMFYFRKYQTNVPYAWFPDSVEKWQLASCLKEFKTTYLTYDNIAGSDLIYLPLILNYYPYIAGVKNYPLGTNYIFTSDSLKGISPYIFQSINDFKKLYKYWPVNDTAFLLDSTSGSGKYAYKMDAQHEWGPTFNCSLDKMIQNKDDIVLISVSLYPLGIMKDVEIVASIESQGKAIYWSATDASKFISDNSAGKWGKAYHAINLPGNYSNYPDVKVKVYIWNKGRKNFYLTDFGVRVIAGNPMMYTLVEKTD